MQPWPDTRDTLLARLHDPADRQAWEQFASIYQPLVYRAALRRGLQDADAMDVSQRVLLAVSNAAHSWKEGNPKGQFRGWLSRVTSNVAINVIQREGKFQAAGDSDAWELLNQQADSPELSQMWQQERKLELFRYAAKLVSPKFTTENWQCFWRTSIENESIENVAQDLGKSVGAVYAARSRILASIRQQVASIEKLESNNEDGDQ